MHDLCFSREIKNAYKILRLENWICHNFLAVVLCYAENMLVLSNYEEFTME